MTDNVREELNAILREHDGWWPETLDVILSRFDVTPKGQPECHCVPIAGGWNFGESSCPVHGDADPKGQAPADVAALIAEARELLAPGGYVPPRVNRLCGRLADALERASQPVTEMQARAVTTVADIAARTGMTPDEIVRTIRSIGEVTAEPTMEEWAVRARAARDRAIAKGYTREHDAEHGIRHLLNWAIDYARRGRAEDSSGLILSTLALLDADEPVTKEWEYGHTSKWGRFAAPSRAVAEERAAAIREEVEQGKASGDLRYHGQIVRRRPAVEPGPWEPVEAAREAGR